jgi:hypothetical protein
MLLKGAVDESDKMTLPEGRESRREESGWEIVEGMEAVALLKVVKIAGGPPGRERSSKLILREDLRDREVEDTAAESKFFRT